MDDSMEYEVNDNSKCDWVEGWANQALSVDCLRNFPVLSLFAKYLRQSIQPMFYLLPFRDNVRTMFIPAAVVVSRRMLLVFQRKFREPKFRC